jgi:hypothetical protein
LGHSQVIPNVITFFVSPEKIYELYVLDCFSSKLKDKNVKFQQSNEYQIIINGYSKGKKSIPDILVEPEDSILLIDVKWKILEKEPSDEDILKLERDTKVWKKSGKKLIPILIYPKIVNPLLNRKFNRIRLNFPDEKTFGFYISQIDISH